MCVVATITGQPVCLMNASTIYLHVTSGSHSTSTRTSIVSLRIYANALHSNRHDLSRCVTAGSFKTLDLFSVSTRPTIFDLRGVRYARNAAWYRTRKSCVLLFA